MTSDASRALKQSIVPRFIVPHFEEARRHAPTSPTDRLPEAIYATALDYLVITCVDLVLTRGDRVLLAKRNREPHPGWWLIGGRMAAGESPAMVVQRKATEEAGLVNLAIDRFQFIGVYSTCFARRSQPPQKHGLHSVNLTYQLELTDQEMPNVQLVSSEYDEWQWFHKNDIETVLKPELAIDQALLRIIQDLPH